MVEARDALCAGDTDFVYTIDGLGVMAWAYPSNVDVASNGSAKGFARPSSTAPLRNFPDGSDPLLANQTFNLSLVEGRSEPEQIVDAVLRQLGRPYHQERCPVSYEEAGPTGCLILQGVGYVDNPDGPACCALAQYRMGQVDVGVFSGMSCSCPPPRALSCGWEVTCKATTSSMKSILPSPQNDGPVVSPPQTDPPPYSDSLLSHLTPTHLMLSQGQGRRLN